MELEATTDRPRGTTNQTRGGDSGVTSTTGDLQREHFLGASDVMTPCDLWHGYTVYMILTEPVTESLGEVSVEQFLEARVALVSSPSVGSNPKVPLFLPEQESPTSPSPNLPPLFGSVANLAIGLTGNDDELYDTEEACVGRVSVAREVVDLAAGQGIVKEELL
ncbi:hypothetical protein F5876DRAFT_81244 [Lentinula aff. lateritia]|uniref:Uncharacterized protein n=1 Tax=Lentinula aff. lateritia TaxID=2804960 RepID=A0ACC1TMH8_9AGAR|nr:hypothetical protein F5876DRAFT_81244 [Lentinula aff. lateritia]